MSKIIEALEKVRVITPRGSTAEPLKPAEEKPSTSSYRAVQQELADVYFARSGKAVPPSAAPMLIRMAERPRSYFVPWLITTAAVILMGIAFFSTKRITIDVHVEDAKGSWAAQDTGALAVETIELPPSEFNFSAAAAQFSSTQKDSITLANGSFAAAAYAYVTFQPEINITQYVLEFEARGKNGKEALEIVMRDSNLQSNANTNPLRPFPTGVDKNWRKAKVWISLSPGFNARRVSQIRFEIGSRTTGNRVNSSVEIRDVRLVPKA